jgi:CheY-like chemotaxis protein/HPt (histidine-containing phosphotransfer) domain-containing protein
VPANRRILVAEDNQVNQQVARRLIERLGGSADTVGNGQEALVALQTKDYDLVLMDCQMPVLDGYAATQAIRNQPNGVRNPRVPVIAMTAHALQGDRERCLAAGMDDYIAKPVQPQALAAVLAKWLQAAPAGAVPEAAVVPGDDRAVFDLGGFQRRMLDDPQLTREVLDTFLSRFPQQYAALQGAVALRDFPRVCMLAHGLKGTAGSISAQRLEAVADQLERAAEAANGDEVREALVQVENRFEELGDAVKRAKVLG